jgi:hypothetical protein
VTLVSPDERREETLIVTPAAVGKEDPGKPVAERRVTLPAAPKVARVAFDAVAPGRWALAWSGARIALSERSSLERRNTFHAEVRAAPDGGFSIEGAPDGEPLLWSASAPGSMEASGLLGGDTRLEIVLDRAQWIAGRVVDPDGKPVPAARVEVRYLFEGWSDTRGDKVVVGEDGTFSTRREVPLAAVVELRAKGFRLAERKLELLPKQGAPRELLLGDVVMDRGRSLRGRVTDAATGGPLVGVSLKATARREERNRLVTDEQETTSGEEGTFALEGIATDGPVRLVARSAGWAPRTLEIEAGRRTFVRAFAFEDPANPSGGAYSFGGTKGSVVVEEGRTATLTLGCDGIRLSGTLLREGAPAEGKVVFFRGPGSREADAMVDAAGGFSLLVSAPGTWSPWIDDPVGLGRKWAPASCEGPPSGLSGCEIDLRSVDAQEKR